MKFSDILKNPWILPTLYKLWTETLIITQVQLGNKLVGVL